MVTVNKFFCFRLHTAGVVLGWLGGALSLLNIITYSILLARIDDIIKYIADNNDATITDEHFRTVAIGFMCIYLTINLIDCFASILLIAGTIRENHLLIVPWLLNCGLSLTFNIGNSVITVVILIMNSVNFTSVLLVAVIAMIVIGIQWAAWLAMYSLFKLIRMSTEQQPLIPDKGASGLPSYTRI